MDQNVVKWLAVAVVGGLDFLGATLGLGLIGYSAMQSLGRNPEARSAIMTNMILVAALTEAVAIYGLVSVILIVLVAKT
jgi:F-type H+-transporting ATPase subunit c